jgi:hypothetical protein
MYRPGLRDRWAAGVRYGTKVFVTGVQADAAGADSRSAGQEISRFCWNPRIFITVFTRAHFWTLF